MDFTASYFQPGDKRYSVLSLSAETQSCYYMTLLPIANILNSLSFTDGDGLSSMSTW